MLFFLGFVDGINFFGGGRVSRYFGKFEILRKRYLDILDVNEILELNCFYRFW